ncbi:ATP synthase subunit H-domain-containing protein [Lentinula aff. detonsa]|uniref:ATP synthase subunit H-domain-containing protein n=1 Tax=Lentinula detonsa TaxID=2804962 RepID=A0AA38PNS7_9AGAR|nr:ATP synthase subunit H-domain-containing protein [Lentinula aff. detonsa]KAJ3978990.1 ATP synthase subunit H-domain-containing protein [Lentinula detonsa]
MPSVLPVLFGLVIAVVLMACAAIFTLKGPQQVLIRTSLMLALAACYLMWMVTYFAQLHPLIGNLPRIVYKRYFLISLQHQHGL